MTRALVFILCLIAALAPVRANAEPESPKPEAPQTPTAPPPPRDARAALDRAAAAYEYGDVRTLIDSAHLIVDGELAATSAERGEALALLGIGLALSGARAGAEAAFLERLRTDPRAKLDPTTTRPDIVALFENVRRQHEGELQRTAHERSGKRFVWNLLPPAGQIQNGDRGRALMIGGVELITLAGAITTTAVLRSWEKPGHQFGSHTDDARTLRTLNAVSVALLAVTVVVGIFDAVTRSE